MTLLACFGERQGSGTHPSRMTGFAIRLRVPAMAGTRCRGQARIRFRRPRPTGEVNAMARVTTDLTTDIPHDVAHDVTVGGSRGDFERDGFLVLPDALDRTEVTVLLDE